jgi:hypothetical protein
MSNTAGAIVMGSLAFIGLIVIIIAGIIGRSRYFENLGKRRIRFVEGRNYYGNCEFYAQAKSCFLWTEINLSKQNRWTTLEEAREAVAAEIEKERELREKHRNRRPLRVVRQPEVIGLGSRTNRRFNCWR